MKNSFLKRLFAVFLILMIMLQQVPGLYVHAGHTCPECNKWIDDGDKNFTSPYFYTPYDNFPGEFGYCEEILIKTEATLKEGGVPVFSEPANFAPEYPDPPKRTADLESEDMKKRKNELDKLRQMAESISSSKDKKDEAPADEKAEQKSEQKPETTTTGGNRFCQYCGKPLVEGDSFCRNCGKKIE